MKYTISFAFFFFSCLLSVSEVAKAQTPLQFNDHLSSIADSLFNKGSKWGEKFNEAYKSKKFASIKPQRDQLDKFLDLSILELKSMKDVKNSKALRMTMLNFLFFEKEMVTQALFPLEKLTENASDVDIQAAIDNLTLFAEKEGAELKKVRAEQELYAKTNGFQIEPEVTEE